MTYSDRKTACRLVAPFNVLAVFYYVHGKEHEGKIEFRVRYGELFEKIGRLDPERDIVDIVRFTSSSDGTASKATGNWELVQSLFGSEDSSVCFQCDVDEPNPFVKVYICHENVGFCVLTCWLKDQFYPKGYQPKLSRSLPGMFVWQDVLNGKRYELVDAPAWDLPGNADRRTYEAKMMELDIPLSDEDDENMVDDDFDGSASI